MYSDYSNISNGGDLWVRVHQSSSAINNHKNIENGDLNSFRLYMIVYFDYYDDEIRL